MNENKDSLCRPDPRLLEDLKAAIYEALTSPEIDHKSLSFFSNGCEQVEQHKAAA